MRPRPSDLTQLAKSAGGSFPVADIAGRIDGRETNRVHGDPDMPVWGELSADALREQTESHNVIGELLGADDDTVVVGTHHDGPWSSAVEDGSGIALVPLPVVLPT